jgi:hypothetical protein
MTDNSRLLQLLECLIHVIGRAAVPDTRVREVVGAGAKQVQAFNLADGTQSQQQIAKATGIDQGNLSKTFARWVQNGVAFWVGEGKDAKLLHIYPLPTNGADGPARPKRGAKKKAKGRRS